MEKEIDRYKIYLGALLVITLLLVFVVEGKNNSKYDISLANYKDVLVDEEYVTDLKLAILKDDQGMFPANNSPATIENKVSDAKWKELNETFDFYDKYNATTVLAYEKDDEVSARFYLPVSNGLSNDDIVDEYSQQLMRDGYQEKEEGYFVKGDSSYRFIVKWDRIIVIAKGL